MTQPTWDDIETERMRREDEAVVRRLSSWYSVEDESDNRAWWLKRGAN